MEKPDTLFFNHSQGDAMSTFAICLLALYVPCGVLLYGMGNAARRADTLDARARAIAKQNVRRRRAALATARTSFSRSELAVV